MFRSQSTLMSELQRTVLRDQHAAAGARLVPFAGWEMPVQYAGVIPEVRAVREHCGVFDVSHMAQFDVAGPDVTHILNEIVTADWSKIGIGRVAYALLLNEQGGVLDDIMGYRLGEERWLVVSNASRAAVDEAHLQKYLGDAIRNRYANQAMLAIQGPDAAAVLQPLIDNFSLTELKWRDVREVKLVGATGLMARGGYTGSDGFEFMFAAEDAARVWLSLLSAGAVPCGLGARDVLRLEAGLPLYGHELREEWTPDESGCSWAVKRDKSTFIGRDALLQKAAPTHTIKPLRLLSKAIPREEYAVARDGQIIGEITSGTLSPTLNAGIALARLPVELVVGDRVQVLIRERAHDAEIVTRPFVAHAPR
jgi:aminomethyltransferase